MYLNRYIGRSSIPWQVAHNTYSVIDSIMQRVATPWAVGVGVTSTDVASHINVKDIVRVLSTRQRDVYNGHFSNGRETGIAG